MFVEEWFYVMLCYFCYFSVMLFIMGVKRSKNVGHHGWPTTKNKKKHWLKPPRAVPQKTKFGPNINDSKSHICNSYFENITSGIRLWSAPSSRHHQKFFLFQIFEQKVSKVIKTSEKDHSFYNTVTLKKSHSFYVLQLTWHWK